MPWIWHRVDVCAFLPSMSAEFPVRPSNSFCQSTGMNSGRPCRHVSLAVPDYGWLPRHCSPMTGSRNPYAIGETGCLKCNLICKCAAGGGKERIHGRLVYCGILGITLALDGPIVAHFCLCHKVYTCVCTSEILTSGNSSHSQTFSNSL